MSHSSSVSREPVSLDVDQHDATHAIARNCGIARRGASHKYAIDPLFRIIIDLSTVASEVGESTTHSLKVSRRLPSRGGLED
ncbi:hypothetical protein CJ178_19635 [Rhodococcus sp. ACPA4]|nr:hypothetical protein CJ178_19635 [Rhodococcus sp. ACPA4]